jgi:hypothetical protein
MDYFLIRVHPRSSAAHLILAFPHVGSPFVRGSIRFDCAATRGGHMIETIDVAHGFPHRF